MTEQNGQRTVHCSGRGRSQCFLGAQGQGPPTYLSLEMTTESPAKKATMMSMKCNNVAFIPLFTWFLILGSKRDAAG
ncbi:hypothetical protein M431DRAFT_505766 [Trichoderma harzianum CBS 226.95]|uniref:Uncharacterized protein n=1 Tax=Trichoderma harzianum CBS 226.95 TaxID=983964 RepID=A0A2T4AMC8_TRIHA|nr:hypothetical protein M431DRAFT_505766 [Trichoderma harzianum CBS 226.95]PTB58224.1 hypothetical protein M431DRAFT_505766 [Trichoderma harzianum CBS 226.95]